MNAIMFDLFVRNPAAIGLGEYPNSFIAASIFSAVSSRSMLLLFKYLETEAADTPASFATSIILAI